MSDDNPPPGGGGCSASSPDKLASATGELQAGAEIKVSDSVAGPTTSSDSTTGAWASGGKKKCQGRNYADIISEAKKIRLMYCILILKKKMTPRRRHS